MLLNRNLMTPPPQVIFWHFKAPHIPSVRHRNFIVKSICIYICNWFPGVRAPKDWKPYMTFWWRKKNDVREKARRVIGVTNARVVKVKEIYEQNTRGIFSGSVYILCNILGACPGGFIEGIRCITNFNGRRTLCARICVDRRPRYLVLIWRAENSGL